jgi:hypothetical protein
MAHPSPTVIDPLVPQYSDERPGEFKLKLPEDLSAKERQQMEADAREYERRCWVETGAPPKWDLLLRADPEFAKAVEEEGERIYREAKAEVASRERREAELQLRLVAELKREAQARIASESKAVQPVAMNTTPMVSNSNGPLVPAMKPGSTAIDPSLPYIPPDVIKYILLVGARWLASQGDEATLRNLAMSFRAANRIATAYRWPLIWNPAVVRKSLKGRVENLRYGAKGNVATSKPEILEALEDLIRVICDPEVSPEDTRRALDDFLSTHTRGYPPPKDLMTKSVEFTSAKSMWLKRYRMFYPGADSTEQGMKIPDFVSSFGPGDNVRASGCNQVLEDKTIVPVLKPDSKMQKQMDQAYNSVVTDIRAKLHKYQKGGKVVVTIDATTAPWMDPEVIRQRIKSEGLGTNLDGVFLLKGGAVERVWP